MNVAFLFRDPALDLLGRIGARVALDHGHAFHQNHLANPVDFNHAAGLALVAPGDNFHLVVLLDPDLVTLATAFLVMLGRRFHARHQITSGASDTIFMNFLSRSSRATGPNTRVPTGSPTSLINTAALESKRI